MSTLSKLMQDFHAAILDNAPAACAGSLRVHPRLSPERQMAIYTEGYRLRLAEAIGNEYPATHHLLGGEAFAALVAGFIESTPPSHYSLDRYPPRFAAYMRGHAEDAFAAELAGLEAAIAEVFHSPESPALQAHILQGLTAEAFSSLHLAPRAASRLLAFAYPAESYLSAFRNHEAPPRPPAASSYLFVVRHPREVKRHALGEAEYCVLSSLFAGLSVGDALEQAVQQHPQLLEAIASHVQQWFAHWTTHGFFQPPEG